MIKRTLQGFTLIELLLVIAILGILAVALLVAINPGEAQKKARDSKRFADLKTLQIILEQYINDGGAVTAIETAVDSSSVTTRNSIACGASTWLGIDTCVYSPTIPMDPLNGQSITLRSDGSGGTIEAAAGYKVIASGADYEVNVRIESASNAPRLINDGGNSTQWLEGGSNLTLMTN